MKTLTAFGPQGFGCYDFTWSPSGPQLERSGNPTEGVLCPGFVDIHIHGAFGIDFMSASADEMSDLCQKLKDVGYEHFYPTTITASPEDVERALSVLPDSPFVPGFHLEGPFISPEFPGAQPPDKIADFEPFDSKWEPILTHPKLKVITLAPEKKGAGAWISRLHKQGTRVSMGHTAATFDEAEKGFEAGVRHSTHTFNAMKGFHHREAGAAGFCLAEDRLSCEIIYDRVHVSRQAAEVLFKAKPVDQVIAVSDSTMASGMEPGRRITMWGLECITGHGEVRLASNNSLAGSAITLLDAFQRLAQDFGPETAIRAASLNPRQAMGLTDMPKVWLEFDPNFELQAIHRC